MWNELTILWNDLTIGWNDLTMGRNDWLPSCPQQTTNEQNKIFVTENTESDTFCMEEYSKKLSYSKACLFSLTGLQKWHMVT